MIPINGKFNGVVLWFDVEGELVCTACHNYDIDRGYVQIDRYTCNGCKTSLHVINDCKGVSHHPFIKRCNNILKWEERSKLFEKYPQLKKLTA